MGTVIFDFDSTLITCESLEAILEPKLKAQPQLPKQLAQITDLGMEGKLSFQESLRRRLELAAPTRNEVTAFGEKAISFLTPGMADIVSDLLENKISVHILSGGLVEAIRPVALKLGLPASHIHAVSLKWDETGNFLDIDPEDLFSISKVSGAKPLAPTWKAPRVAIGDGMTDYHLLKYNLVDHFLAFTENVRREPVVNTRCPEATSVVDLKNLLENLL